MSIRGQYSCVSELSVNTYPVLQPVLSKCGVHSRPAELTLRSCTVDTACNRTSAVVQSGSRLLPAVQLSWNERAESPAVGPRCGSTHFQLGPCLAPKWGATWCTDSRSVFLRRNGTSRRHLRTFSRALFTKACSLRSCLAEHSTTTYCSSWEFAHK